MAKKEYLQIRSFDGLQNLKNSRDIGFGLSKAQNVSIDKRGVIRTIGGLETHGEVPTQAAIIAPGYGIEVFDTDHKSGAAAKDTGENWLALADAVNGKIDLYNLTDDSFTASAIDLGTVTSYAPGAGKIDFPTTSTLTDSDSSLITTGKVKVGDVVKVSGCTTTTANNIVIIIKKAAEGTLTARGNPFTIQATEAGTVTLTVLQTSIFHYVNEALRVASAAGGAAMRPRHYGYTKRTHFPGLTDEEDAYNDWAASGPGPGVPTDLSVTAVDGDAAAGALTAGLGVEIGVAQNSDKGEWPASPDPGTIDWEVAISRVYEHGQESYLYVPATAQTFQTADNDSLDITVLAKTTGNSYGARVSGFRGYFRKEGSDDPWVLLVDIDMNKGARATLSGDYAAWLDGGTANVVYTTAFDSFRQNVDTYESLTGINPETPRETFSTYNSFWRCSLVAKNRTFIANLKYTDKDGNLIHHRDSLFYSQPNAYDLYSIDNEITVTKGDAEEPVQLAFFNDRILMFKQRTLYIVNIASSNDGDWFRESKHKFRGVEHPGAVTETPHGIAWCNEFGVFLYNGSEIVPLLGDKIELSEHPLAYQRYMEFNGSSDYVTKSNDADLNFGEHTDFSLEAIVRIPTTVTGSHGRIAMKGDTITQAWVLGKHSTGVTVLYLDDGVSPANITADTEINDGAFHHLVGTADRDGNGQIYLDGVTDHTAVDISDLGSLDETGKPFAIGIDTRDLAINPFDGDIALVRIWNRVLTPAEVLALYKGQPVLPADRWGAEKVTNGSMEIDDNWNNFNSPTVNERSATQKHSGSYSRKFTPDEVNEGIQSDPFTTVTGGKSRYAFWVYPDTTTRVDVAIRKGDGSGYLYSEIQSGLNIDAWNKIIIDVTETAGGAGAYIAFHSGVLTGGIWYIDDVSGVVLGCVAEYAPRGIGDAVWEDQSDNSLDGTVVGATAIYEDSWAKFYTDYSILGYHALTNQIIIMRDCTGKWSSGYDYGDAWIIDLDTGFITTGRRVFTKGVVYSNFCTDWNQDLIIGEQSGANVIMKRWTDSSVSQAVGLIDIRTADFDFNNPATKKIMDAFIATYKSSALQADALSYAIDGDDRQIAWTKLTGDLDPEGNWEKLVIEPGSFNCDSIRLRISNPTNVGTIEINDVSLRHEEQFLKLV